MKGIPVFLNLENKRVIVIGGGPVGFRKAVSLISEGIRPIVISPVLCQEFSGHIDDFDHIAREFVVNDAIGVDVAFIATDNIEINKQLKKQLKENKAIVSICNDLEEGDFYSMAYNKVDEVIYSLSTGGEVPFLTKRLKEEFEKVIIDVLNGSSVSDLSKLRKIFIDKNERDEISKILKMDENEIKRLINDED